MPGCSPSHMPQAPEQVPAIPLSSRGPWVRGSALRARARGSSGLRSGDIPMSHTHQAREDTILRDTGSGVRPGTQNWEQRS